MGDGWIPIRFRFSSFIAFVVVFGIKLCFSLNDEGLALLAFRAQVTSDPRGALIDWNLEENDPCRWSGVHCVGGEVHRLDLSGLMLKGTLTPELGRLSHLRSLILYKNCFFGTIPREIEGLTHLELLDLRDNNFSGTIPAEIGRITNLKCLLLCDNEFEGSVPSELQNLSFLYELQFDDNLVFLWDAEVGCVYRKLGHCIWQRNPSYMKSSDSSASENNAFVRYPSSLPNSPLKLGKDSLRDHKENNNDNLPSSVPHDVEDSVQKLVDARRRKLLDESSNLAAAPVSSTLPNSDSVNSVTSARSSGTFPAVPKPKQETPPPAPVSSFPPPQPQNTSSQSDVLPIHQPQDNSSGNFWKYAIIIGGVSLLLILAAIILCMCRSRGVTTIGPWKTGLSGQLQKAFITGAPKLNRPELEVACEDFSNIIDTFDCSTIYKGTLSSGVEIAVASVSVTSSKDWSKSSEQTYRKKIDTLSRINHKNFVNLLGYCEEEEPFTRMMVFEYAPNGTLYEHLHVKEVEHLDWGARMRIIMGTAYCLQYMHHDLNPPVAHTNLTSSTIYLTDDYAAKIAEIIFLSNGVSKYKNAGDHDAEHSELPPLADPESNVYSFGVLLLEIISGKLPYSEDQGPLVNWAAEFLNDKWSISYMIDQSLKSFKNNELDVICEVIQDCIKPDPRMRPSMKDVTAKLREVIGLSPDQSVPRLSPLWWAELEILSVEAT
ncbi:protein MALE DISCOVERER 2-like [Momordica charantia]|uniref:Protein MALE DISCOVERER 2-like n=1 Tax=Momordica charantia TaxID=3673 RepID=A0A6J1CHG3_MOMCH|nr:protein MALE DISCOVERER 2-like [Momordica charantia]